MLFILFLNLISIIDALKCTAKPPCGCELGNGDYMDLSPMMGTSTMFIGVDMKDSDVTFNVDLCQKFTCVNSNDALVCGSSGGEQQTVYADKLSSFEVDDNTKVPTFVYTSTVGTTVATTRVTLHCGTAQGIGSLSDFEMQQLSLVFTTTLTSQYACWHTGGGGGGGGDGGSKNGLSVGSILCIVLLVVVIVYLVAGILINKYARKIEDGSLVPNAEFWKSLPGYMKDGFKFTISKIKRSDDYEKI